MNKKNIFLMIIAYGLNVNAQTISINANEWTLVGVSEIAVNMNVSNYINTINVESIYTVVNGAGKSYNTDAPFPGAPVSAYQAFTEFKAGTGYWIKAKENNFSFDITGTAVSNLLFNSGWNLVSIPSNGLVSDYITNTLSPNGFTIESIYTVVNGAGKSYNTEAPFPGAPISAYQAFSNFNASQGYWVKVSSIDYNKLVQNGISAPSNLATTLPTLANTAVEGKSMLLLESNTTDILASVITFESGYKYKQVDLGTFDVSSLNSSDLNTTLQTQVTALTSGVCGKWNPYPSTFTLTQIDSNNNEITNSSLTISYNSTDGNYTQVSVFPPEPGEDAVSDKYTKIAWIGDSLTVDSSIDCIVTETPVNELTGVIQKTVEYDGITPTTVPISLPVGTFDIYAEYTGTNNTFLQTMVLKDENNSTIAGKSSTTLGTSPSHVTITNSSTSNKMYNIDLSQALMNGTAQSGNIWLGIIDNNESTTYPTSSSLVLGDVETNIGQILSSSEDHIWSFDINSTQGGTYSLNITTDINSTINPLQNFHISIEERGNGANVSATNEATTSGSISIAAITLENSKNYQLNIVGESTKADLLGSYKIKLIKQ